MYRSLAALVTFSIKSDRFEQLRSWSFQFECSSGSRHTPNSDYSVQMVKGEIPKILFQNVMGGCFTILG